MPFPPDSSAGRFLEPLSRPWHSYTRRFNVRHKQWRRLFDDRHKSVLVESERSDVGGSGGSSYLTTLLDYIHLNPARARLLNKEALMTKLDERKLDDVDDGKLAESAPYKGEGQMSDLRLRDAQRIIDAGVGHFGLSVAAPGAFRDLPRGDLRSVVIAWMLWRKTSMPQKWIADQLALRSAANVSQRVRLFDKSIDKELAKEFVTWKGRQLEF